MSRIQIGDIARIRRGASPRPIADPRWFSDAGPGWVRIGDVTRGGKYLRATEQKLSAEGALRSVRVQPGDVIMSVAASVGITAIVDMDACIHDGWVVLTDFAERADREFLFYLLTHHAPAIAAVGQTGSQNNINSEILRDWTVDLPTLPVQRRVSALLATVDRVLAQLRELILRKISFKRALLNQLVTGRRRFPEFAQSRLSSESAPKWNRHPLSVVLHEKSQRNAGQRVTEVFSCSKLYGIVPQTQRFGKRLASKNVASYKVVMPGDLVYDPMLLWDASIGFVQGDSPGIVSPAYATFIFDESQGDRDFYSYLLASHAARHAYKVISRGTNVRRKKAMSEDFIRIELRVPDSLDEQRRIGRLLRTVDHEIAQLELLRDAHAARKRALMHRLLSGDLPLSAPTTAVTASNA